MIFNENNKAKLDVDNALCEKTKACFITGSDHDGYHE